MGAQQGNLTILTRRAGMHGLHGCVCSFEVLPEFCEETLRRLLPQLLLPRSLPQLLHLDLHVRQRIGSAGTLHKDSQCPNLAAHSIHASGTSNCCAHRHEQMVFSSR